MMPLVEGGKTRSGKAIIESAVAVVVGILAVAIGVLIGWCLHAQWGVGQVVEITR